MQKAQKLNNDDLPMVGDNSSSKLKSYVERVERAEKEKAQVADVIKSIYSEAKAFGYDTRVLRKVIKRRAMEAEKRHEEDELLDLYECTLANLNDMMG